MAVTSVQPVSTRVSGESGGNRTYTSLWQVITDSVSDSAVTARIAVGLPSFGSSYAWGTSYDYGAWVQSAHTADLKEENVSRKVWSVTVVHTSQGRSREATQPDDPLGVSWEVAGDSDEWVEEAHQTVPGPPDNKPKQILDASRRALTGKEVERFRTRRKITLSRNYASINQNWIDTIEGSMNSSTVAICGGIYPPLTLYMRKIPWQRLYVAGSQVYYRVTFMVDVNKETHNLKIVSRGRLEYSGAGDVNDPANYIEIPDNYTQNPQPDGSYFLGADGRILSANETPVILNGPNGYQVYYATEWNVIGFPAT